MDISIHPVRTKRDRKKFLEFPWIIYRNDPNWVPPLIPERKRAIDPQKGVFFQRGQADFFLVYRDRELVGTFSLAEDFKASEFLGFHEAQIGFFEVIDDYHIAEAIFNYALDWAHSRGMRRIIGPFNLDSENAYGILVSGHERPPALLCGHTPAYYQGFFEDYGFFPLRGANLAYEILIDREHPHLTKLLKVADRVREKGKVNVRSADFDHIDLEVDRLHGLLNKALAHLPGHRAWQREAVEALIAPFKSIADPDLILFAEVDGETVGFFPAVPDLNEVFIKVNGLRYPWNYIQLWWYLRQPIHRMTIKSVLVDPEYWGYSGVAVLMMAEMLERLRERDYSWVDLSLTSDDNPFTPTLAENMGARVYKKYQVYQYDLSGLEK